MKTVALTLAALAVASTAVAHPKAEAHVCGIDPAMVKEYPGYGTRGNIYDRGDYFFAVEVTNFNTPIAYKHWRKVESITNHIRIYKDDCRVSNIEIVHPVSKEKVEKVAEATAPRWILSMGPGAPSQTGMYNVILSNTLGFSQVIGTNIEPNSSEYRDMLYHIDVLANASQAEHDAVFAHVAGYEDDPDYANEAINAMAQNILQPD